MYLSASSDAIDASLITKDRAVEAFLRDRRIPARRVAVIGDSVNDLPFLLLPELGLRGAPANAQVAVRDRLRDTPDTFMPAETFTAGFLEFYRVAAQEGMTHVFADRDGVLIGGEPEQHREALMDLFAQMGVPGRPFVIVLTGSSYAQNQAFMDRHGLDARLMRNAAIARTPHVVWAENGSIRINVLDRTATCVELVSDPTLLGFLKAGFEETVRQRVGTEVLPAFGMRWATGSREGDSDVYVPPKATMFTINVPRIHGAERDYRRSQQSDAFREAVLRVMTSVADQAGVRYEILGATVQYDRTSRQTHSLARVRRHEAPGR